MRVRRLAYHCLLHAYQVLRPFKLYYKLWNLVCNPAFDVQATVHGTKAVLPSNYLYPYTCRYFPTFNNPYLQLVHETYAAKNRPLNIIDVGAAVGDSYLFIQQNIPQAVNTIFCIEGNPYFLRYLYQNIGKNAVVLETVLSDRDEQIPSFTMPHTSTASIQGSGLQPANRLDTVLIENNVQPVDVLKIDVDGFDGKVIAGAVDILAHNKPAVIFEFHPWLLKDTENEFYLPFETLAAGGYHHFLWYDKFGVFIQHHQGFNITDVDAFVQQSLQAGRDADIHFDVIALPADTNLKVDRLQHCNEANQKKYVY